jgi:hypothetical protein
VPLLVLVALLLGRTPPERALAIAALRLIAIDRVLDSEANSIIGDLAGGDRQHRQGSCGHATAPPPPGRIPLLIRYK